MMPGIDRPPEGGAHHGMFELLTDGASASFIAIACRVESGRLANAERGAIRGSFQWLN
jgi:hypothetical protein